MDTQVDIERIRARAREVSKRLLGAQFRAEVAAFIAVGRAPFWARGMAKLLDVPENKVAAELTRFAEDGLLTAMSMDWDRRRLYERASGRTRYWDGAYELIEGAAEEEAIRVGVDAAAAMEVYLAAVHGASRWSRSGEES